MEGPLWRLQISSRSISKHGHHRRFFFSNWSISKQIFYSETAWSNESKLGRNHLLKVFYEDWSIRVNLLTNMVTTCNSCCFIRDSNCWVHPWFLVGSVLLFFLAFYVVCLRPVSCVPNVASFHGLSIIDFLFGFLERLCSTTLMILWFTYID
jgi:hypothetical protein